MIYIIKSNKNNKKNLIIKCIYIISYVIILRISLFPFTVEVPITSLTPTYNLILDINLFEFHQIANVLLYMPYGFAVFINNKFIKNNKMEILKPVLLSISVESAQLISSIFSFNRVFDINDIIENSLGGIIGFIVAYIICNSKLISQIKRGYINGVNKV